MQRDDVMRFLNKIPNFSPFFCYWVNKVFFSETGGVLGGCHEANFKRHKNKFEWISWRLNVGSTNSQNKPHRITLSASQNFLILHFYSRRTFSQLLRQQWTTIYFILNAQQSEFQQFQDLSSKTGWKSRLLSDSGTRRYPPIRKHKKRQKYSKFDA